jgi:hypothetical protein
LQLRNNSTKVQWTGLSKGAAAVGKGNNELAEITNKLPSEKLLAAWKIDGSPTDSEELTKFLTTLEVQMTIVNKVYTDLKISAAPEAQAATGGYAEVKKAIAS